ncbi:pentatricopeptide repeat-containing protein At2g13600 [Cryptomeria japonica]|uniref:pentatricopeptide repeat-containing protein At2g13600 n=1 Tax=Cryptomeria japonica TaxID=3369 RepID=UPI0027DA2D4B|nr:pentatricopeptide repeat-containing protein At2g13600 [Cryptomeria japonica]
MAFSLQLPLAGTTLTLALERDSFKTKCDAKKLHTHFIKTGKHSDIFLATKLVQMYGKSVNIEDARHIFDEMSQRNLVTWNVMIGVYVQCGEAEEALKLFRLMRKKMIKMSHFTASSVVKACTALSALKQGRELHAHVIRSGFELDIVLYTTLIEMYWKGGSKLDACKVFDEMPLRNVISWSVMISGCVQNGFEEKAVALFSKMQEMGFNPNQYIYSSIIKACAGLLLVELGKQLHALVSKAGLESDVIVGSALVDGYVKCGNIEAAQIVFGRMSRWDVVSWTTMIVGYIQVGRDDEALELFFQMLQHNLMKPNHFTYSAVLRACSDLADMESGKQIHAHLIKTLFESNASVDNSLISMYARCGNIDDSRKVFDLMSRRNVVSWNAMITGYALHGNCEEGIRFFKQMQLAGIKPNHITFVGVLSACSHGGLVEQGRGFFHSMSVDHGIEATMEHYACMVDLFGRAGRLEEALEIIRQIPQEPTALIWRTLLGACKVHGNLELGYRAAQALLKLEPNDSATYVLLSGMYATYGRWDDVAKLRKIMKDNGVRKEDPGHSWIQIKNRVYVFLAEDRSNQQTEEVYPINDA